MTPGQAKVIVESLARGIAPSGVTLLADDSPLSHPQLVRALFLAAQALDGLTLTPPRSSGKPPPNQAGKSWSAEEDQRLLSAFDEGLAVVALAGEHERSSGAIRSRLIRLGRLLG